MLSGNPNDWVSVIIATYAAIVSTYTLILVIRHRKPNLKVTLSNDEETGNKKNILTITANNTGRKPITVTTFGIVTPEGKKLLMSTRDEKTSWPPLPARLKESQICNGWFDLEINLPYLLKFGNKVVIQGFFRDAEKKDHLSPPVEIELPQLPDNVTVLRRS